MKRIISFVLIAVFCGALLAACAHPAQTSETPTAPTTGGQAATTPDTGAGEPTTGEPTTGEPTEPAEPFDMEAFLKKIAEDHRGADAETLCNAILESPYFSLFDKQSTYVYTPGFPFDYSLRNAGDGFCVVDNTAGDVVVVILPAEGVDAKTLVMEMGEKANPAWTGEENVPDKKLAIVQDGVVFFAMYHSDMQPVTVFAEKARDYIDMFHDYCKEHPDATCLEMATFFARYQKLADMYTEQVEEGKLRGFGGWIGDEDQYKEVEITGFIDGAHFEPRMEPNGFLGYVFTVEDSSGVEDFVELLRENANLGYNVCTAVNSLHIEIDGDRVLFMMFNEQK